MGELFKVLAIADAVSASFRASSRNARHDHPRRDPRSFPASAMRSLRGGRRLRRGLFQPQWRHRLAGQRQSGRRQPHPHGGGPRCRAGSAAHRLPDPLAARRDHRGAVDLRNAPPRRRDRHADPRAGRRRDHGRLRTDPLCRPASARRRCGSCRLARGACRNRRGNRRCHGAARRRSAGRSAPSSAR